MFPALLLFVFVHTRKLQQVNQSIRTMSATQHKTRKLVDIAQKARGRTPLKYELEVIPFFAGELPSGLEKVSFAWERGSKLFTTDAQPVNPHTRAVFWKQYLRQVSNGVHKWDSSSACSVLCPGIHVPTSTLCML